MNIEEAIKKGYLSNKEIKIIPSPRIGKMGIKNENHITYFMHDDCSVNFCLPLTSRGDLVNIFTSEDERKYFEEATGQDLNKNKQGNFFEKFKVKIIMSRSLLKTGFSFNLADPMDNLRFRVVKANSDIIAPSWNERKLKNSYKWAIVDSEKIESESSDAYNINMEYWNIIGKYNTESDLKILLKMYYGLIGSSKTIPSDATKLLLMKEINKIGESDVDKKKFVNMCIDKFFHIRKFILKGIEKNVFKKESLNTYVIKNESQTYTFNELVKEISALKEIDDDKYFKLESEIEDKQE
jgi:hypothetical protein